MLASTGCISVERPAPQPSSSGFDRTIQYSTRQVWSTEKPRRTGSPASRRPARRAAADRRRRPAPASRRAGGTPAPRPPPPSAAALPSASSPSSRPSGARGGGFPARSSARRRRSGPRPSVSVSPIRSVPWLGMPTTSPAKASSATSGPGRRRIAAPTGAWACRCAPASPSCRGVSLPEHSRANAMRSRWFGSMLAWILKTKAAHARLGRLDLAQVRSCAPRRQAPTCRAPRADRRRRNCAARCRKRPASDGPRETPPDRTACRLPRPAPVPP